MLNREGLEILLDSVISMARRWLNLHSRICNLDVTDEDTCLDVIDLMNRNGGDVRNPRQPTGGVRTDSEVEDHTHSGEILEIWKSQSLKFPILLLTPNVQMSKYISNQVLCLFSNSIL